MMTTPPLPDWIRNADVARDSGEPLGRLIAAYHPSARVSRETM